MIFLIDSNVIANPGFSQVVATVFHFRFCHSVAAIIRPGVTEYSDPPLKILAPALISQRKWAPLARKTSYILLK